jgi:hypothetical protein
MQIYKDRYMNSDVGTTQCKYKPIGRGFMMFRALLLNRNLIHRLHTKGTLITIELPFPLCYNIRA